MSFRSTAVSVLLSLLAFVPALPVTVPAAEPKPTPRHDPAGQLFRRAPMAQSARSIIVNLGTNLHAAFDTELARIHTIWRGGALNLWGPPYSHSKSPFISDFDGSPVYSFPKFSPWFADGKQVQPNFRAVQIEDGTAKFRYQLPFNPIPINIIETVEGTSIGDQWTIRRAFEFPEGNPTELRYLAFAEGGAAIESNGALKIRGTNGTTHFQTTTRPPQWQLTRETVDYSSEVITDAGTELGNPILHFSGEESRAYLAIPKSESPFSFAITMSNANRPLPISAPEKATPQIFTGETSRRDSGDEFYRIEHLPLPPAAEMLITGMDWLNATDLAVCTWLGEIYIVENAIGDVSSAKYRRFARGLNEPLGLTVLHGNIYVVQKGELTRVADTNSDGEADLFECVNDDWGYSGNYHSYSFGPLTTAENNFMVFVTGQRGRYDLPYQGWAIRVTNDAVAPFCSGLRVPHGWGKFQDNILVTDNQGNWIGACRLNHLQEGKFYGYPSSRPSPKGPRPESEVEPPALWFPRSLSPSTSGFEVITNDTFGPFRGQLIIGDFQNSVLMRASLEKVNGKWQGAVFPFAKGFLSGVNRLKFGPDSNLYVGGGKRTWSTAAPREFSLDRVSYSGKLPFEVSEVRATKTGFELRFTNPLEREPALDPENYLVKQFTYKYHEDYGSPEFDHNGKVGATETPVDKVEISPDAKTVRLEIPGLKTGFVTAFQLAINGAGDEDLRNEIFYYTLNQQPE